MKKYIVLLLMFVSVVLMQQASAITEKRIKPSKVNLRNYETFVSQIREDLPVGTSIEEVEEYLSNRGISYGVSETEGLIKFTVQNIASFLFIVTTSLQVKIYVTYESDVSKITGETYQTGP